MSSNFYPSQTSGIPGIAGALNSQYPDAEQMPLPNYESALAPSQPQQAPSQFASQIDLLGQFGQQMAQSQAPPEAAIQNVSFNAKTGMAKLEMPQSALAEVMGQLTDLKTMKAAAMARVAQLRQQEASGSPILDALSQFAGGMAANDPTMPGWVRALGATNLQMGNQGIKRERMVEEQRAMQYGEASAGIAQSLMRFQEQSQQKQEADADRDAQLRIAQQNADTARANQVNTAKNTEVDNFRADIAPAVASAKATGMVTPEVETSIRALKGRYPNMTDADIQREVDLAKGVAKAALAEKVRQRDVAAAAASAKAGASLARVAAANGMRVNTLVQTEQVKSGIKQATQAKVDPKEAARVEGLHLLAGAMDDIEKDNWWQGVVSGQIAMKAPLTTEQQMLIATRARAFVAKMQTMGLSFAKTSDAEMKKILATVPQPGQTVEAMKQLTALMDRDAKRAAAEIGAQNWAETPEAIAQMLPQKYVAAGVEGHQKKLQTLSPQQIMGLGLVNGDDDLIAAGLARVKGSVAPTGASPQNSTRPGEIRMATPSSKDDPEGLMSFLPKR